MQDTEQNFSWVKARHACSPYAVFQFLQLGCQRDIEERTTLRPLEHMALYSFKVEAEEKSFLVLRGGARPASVRFMWSDAGISVSRDLRVFLEGTLTLDDQGECRLKVGNEPLSFWQFRKRALEDLLFRLDL